MRILVCSDNHMDQNILKEVYQKHQDMDLYIHCGDSETSMKNLRPFSCVAGNNDYDPEYPKFRVIDTPKHSFFVTHGHQEWCDYEAMGEKARATGCDVVLYGHSHKFDDTTYEGIRFINPGSMTRPRTMAPPSYAIIEIDDITGEIEVKRMNIK